MSELYHYGVKGMKWRNKKMSDEYIERDKRGRVSQTNVNTGGYQTTSSGSSSFSGNTSSNGKTKKPKRRVKTDRGKKVTLRALAAYASYKVKSKLFKKYRDSGKASYGNRGW